MSKVRRQDGQALAQRDQQHGDHGQRQHGGKPPESTRDEQHW